MALFEFLGGLDATNLMLLLVIFVLFVLSMKKAFSIVINTVWAAGISLLFPIVMNRLLGFDIPMDPDTLLSFMLVGVGVYFIYVLASSIYKVLGIAEKVIAKVPKPSISIPKGEKETAKEGRKEIQLRERELKLQEREMKLKEKAAARNEKHGKWMARVEESKAPKRKTKDIRADEYVEIKDSEEKPKKKSFAEPMKEIKHKSKKDEDD